MWQARKMGRFFYLGLFSLCASASLVGEEEPHERITIPRSQPGYTINFENIPIIELIKFIGKIGDLNFLYNEQELQFNVTILSQEPTDLPNILSALTQVLRINGFDLLDDSSNLIITRNPALSQIATIISPEVPLKGDKIPMLVTRVFKIKNGNPAEIARILRPLLSSQVSVEISLETRHLIITDTAANIDKISDLLLTLDSPQSPLDLDAYKTKNLSPHDIASLAMQIVTPLSEGNPLILVPQAETKTIFIVSTPFLIEKTLSVLEDLDTTSSIAGNPSADRLLFYKVKNKAPQAIEEAILQLAETLSSSQESPPALIEALKSARYIKTTNSFFITGDPAILAKVQQILEGIDVGGKTLANNQFFLYKPAHRSLKSLAESLRALVRDLSASHLADPNLIHAIEGMKVVTESNGLLFTGDETTITDVKSLLSSLDSPSEEQVVQAGQKFYIYKIQTATEEQISKSLNHLAENLEDSGYGDVDLIHAIDSMRWIRETNSLIFTGSEAALAKLTQILPSFDVAPENSKVPLSQLPPSSEFLLYAPKVQTSQNLMNSIETLQKSLSESGLADPALIRTLQSAKWISSTNSIMFTGDNASLERVRGLMGSIDVLEGPPASTVFIYHIRYVPADTIKKGLNNLAQNLPKEDDLVGTINGMKYAPDSNTLVFKGSASGLKRLGDILNLLDTQNQVEVQAAVSPTYEVYPLQHVSGDVILQDLDRVGKNIQATGIPDPGLVKAINHIEWIKSTNSLYIPGTPDILAKIKALIVQFDVERSASGPTEFYIYKPKFLSAQELLQSIQRLSQEFQQSGLADPDLISALNSAKYVQESDSILFTGSTPAVERVKGMLSSIDNLANKKGGKTTLFVYRLKHVPGQQVLSNLQGIAGDLETSKSDDKGLLQALRSARFTPETNSIVFTGSPDALERVQALLEKFDNEGLAPKQPSQAPETFILYAPQYVPGPDLVQLLHDFGNNLRESGVADPQLFDAINSTKWMPKTSSILISGSQDGIARVQDLLKRFDNATSSGAPQPAPQIDNVDEISFLIYKLQYHLGSEIEDTLRKIASDLALTKANEKNQDLIDSIQSVQWIEVTNSLIGTGKAPILAKLHDLIKSMDIPLKQVFIEVLVIETDVNNSLELGLRWDSQGQYRTKLGWGGGSTPFYETATNDPGISFNKAVQGISATSTPTGSQIPILQGFSLGVIGDLIFHKGASYAALGALIDALRTDSDTSIVLSQKIITQDSKQATIFVGDNIPFQGSFIQNVLTQGNSISTTNIEYRDVGVSLTITPRIGDDGMITMLIDEEITEQTNTGSSSSGSSNTPTTITGIQTSKRSTQTQVTMPDQHFLVLSGSISNTKARTRTSIPCLGGLPLIGAAFQRNETLTNNSNVIIFVKPHLIKDFDVYKQITERQEELYRSQGIPEDFDQGLDMVKTSDDE